jgi:hypothetical protein
MPKLVCCTCKTELRIKRNDVYCVDMFQNPPQPYQVFAADAWECPGCGAVILGGFADYPQVVHFEPGFQEFMDRIRGEESLGCCTIVYNYERPQTEETK